jgi:hypothetical protein
MNEDLPFFLNAMPFRPTERLNDKKGDKKGSQAHKVQADIPRSQEIMHWEHRHPTVNKHHHKNAVENDEVVVAPPRAYSLHLEGSRLEAHFATVESQG